MIGLLKGLTKMKKVIIGLAIATAAFFAKAEYLYWGVTPSEATGNTYNAARLWYSNSDSTSGGTAIGWLTDIPGSRSTDVSSYEGTKDTAYFFVELCNYNVSTKEWTDGVRSSRAYSYASLAQQGVITSSDLIAQASVAAAVLSNAGVQATPEPTSGVLLLMGFAMLGLKRKKEV